MEHPLRSPAGRCALAFEVIDAMKNEHPITEMADAMEVSASGYADHQSKSKRPRH